MDHVERVKRQGKNTLEKDTSGKANTVKKSMSGKSKDAIKKEQQNERKRK